MEETLKTYIIYEITCIDKNIEYSYVGSTQNFRSRKSQHKYSLTTLNNPSFNLNIYKFIRENGGWNNFEMRPLEEFKCETNIQSKIREQYWIDLKQSKLNSLRAFTTEKEKKEYQLQYNKQYNIDNSNILKQKAKDYYANNKEHIHDYNIKYRINNRDGLLKYEQRYRSDNKDKLSENAKIKYECECGSVLRKSDKSAHVKSLKHCKYLHNQNINIAV